MRKRVFAMNYRCYGDGLVKQPPAIVIAYDTVVEDDAECIYRGLCIACITRPLDDWSEMPPTNAQSRIIQPRPTISEQAASIVPIYTSVVRTETGEYIITHHETPGDENTPVVTTRFTAI